MQSELETPMGAYYHWEIHGTGDFDPLSAYLADVSRADAGRLAQEIEYLLASTPDDDRLMRHLLDAGGNLYLGDDPSAYRPWLAEVGVRARAIAQQADANDDAV